MDTLTLAHKTLLTGLLKADVNFLLIGGYAVNYHGYPRYTNDMDIWLKPDEENKIKFAKFLRQIDISPESINHILTLNFTMTNAFHLGQNETRIDFLTKISGVTFDEAEKEKVFLTLDNKNIPVIHFDHLIKNKILSARPKDLADVDELQKVNMFKHKK